MFDGLDRMICNIHGIEFQYPEKHRELSMLPPKCPVCLSEELERIQKELEKTKLDLQRILDAITIKMNNEVKP